MYQKRIEDIRLSGVGMDLPETERTKGDMTKTGQFCPNDGDEMEQVSGTGVYVCHVCGRQETRDKHGKTVQVQFEGTE